MRILFIEDNPEYCQIITKVLEHSDHDVFHSDTGRLGIEIAERENIDLVILDVKLPDMNGFQVAREIHHLPILFLTASVDSDFMEQKIKLHRLSDFIIKQDLESVTVLLTKILFLYDTHQMIMNTSSKMDRLIDMMR